MTKTILTGLFVFSVPLWHADADETNALLLDAPLNYQVVQRQQDGTAEVAVRGRIHFPATSIEVRIDEKGWRSLADLTIGSDQFNGTITLPAGGWYRLQVRAGSKGDLTKVATVDHIGVGEVFVIAGQSNSANHGEEKQRVRSGLATTFDGKSWRLGHDPQPGASGRGGSFIPAFADEIAGRFKVPVGIVATGAGGSSVREWMRRGTRFPNPPTVMSRVESAPGSGWQSKGDLFSNFIGRARSLGQAGFRAVLWHQGESDANQADPSRTLSGKLYAKLLSQLIADTRAELGWEFPWFVAQASYHGPDDQGSPDIRAAQKSLWGSGFALEGPDTDALKGPLRDNGGQGVHFSSAGLKAHGKAWADKVTLWLQSQLNPLHGIGEKERFEITPGLRKAYFSDARMKALGKLKSLGKELPEDFLNWVDSDPEIATGVYAAHHQPEDVLLWLYSLRLDLGREKFETYRQLALATALVSAKEGLEPNITQRDPMTLVIPGDPRKPVETRDPKRELDVNDHIINFLDEHAIEEEVLVDPGTGELKYDKRGIALPVPKRKKGEPAAKTKKTKRTLYAADVMASRALQEKFYAYMKSKGQEVRIDCGDGVIHWHSRDAVRGESYKKINEAYRMFRTAYEEKGLLPKARDPFATPAERCLFVIRNHEYQFPPKLQKERNWPRFPLTAPWTLLTMLAADHQPLREREERWNAFRDHGEFHRYGEYIHGIAQQFPMQSARRLKPYPFTYATIQMMLKDGGVCGTMGSISARGHNILGVPSCQATQPGHCAVVFFLHDPKTGTYRCQGSQYATGGDEKTGPFTPWPFEREFKRNKRTSGHELEFRGIKKMIYHQSLAWGANYDLAAYHDATVAHAAFQALPEEQRKGDGRKLLHHAIALNPYHLLAIDTSLATVENPLELIDLWKTFAAALATAKGKAGCPTDGLYVKTVRNKTYDRLAGLPLPEDPKAIKQVLQFLESEECDRDDLLKRYR